MTFFYEYDGLNRLTKIDYPYTEDTVYNYIGNGIPGAGKIGSVTDEGGTISYEYGLLGEVTKETRTLSTHFGDFVKSRTAVMEYGSDYLGRMQYIIYPDGEKVVYGYDVGGQVVSVTGHHYNNDFKYVTNILYDERGQRSRIEFGNGTNTEYTYDPARLWLATIRTEGPSSIAMQNINYSFDAVGNVLGYRNDCIGGESGNYITTQKYTYDSLYQIASAHGETVYNPFRSSFPEFTSTYDQKFSFDGIGRMSQKISSETVNPEKVIGDDLNYDLVFEYDENYAHRLKKVGDRTYEYDANGNLILEQDGKVDGETKYGHVVNDMGQGIYGTDYGWGLGISDRTSNNGVNNRSRKYFWNEKNMLTSSVDQNVTVHYVYGQDGQRCSKYTVTGETLYFNSMWTLRMDGGNMTNGGQTGKNIYLGDTRIVTKLNSCDTPSYAEEAHRQYFYHSDHLGSASLITDWEGNEYQRIEYTPYGETWVDKTSNTGLEYLPYKFSGKELDEETGLYYYGARYLDPKYSMWLSTDPALGEYIPGLDKDKNKNLPGMGGLFNQINANLFHAFGNNPICYKDPDGRAESKLNELEQVCIERSLKVLDTKLNKIISNLANFSNLSSSVLNQYASVAYRYLGLNIADVADRKKLIEGLTTLKRDLNAHDIQDFKTYTHGKDSNYFAYVHRKSILKNGEFLEYVYPDNFIFISDVSLGLSNKNENGVDDEILHEQTHLSFEAEDYKYGYECEYLPAYKKIKNADSWRLFYDYVKEF